LKTVFPSEYRSIFTTEMKQAQDFYASQYYQYGTAIALTKHFSSDNTMWVEPYSSD